ncbi:MAG TPA: serine/threonine-protein phosphatase, partial [Firmicutes bacterium]|nr:serine/threonine-protein phosphatase [Bacillota bacterium]
QKIETLISIANNNGGSDNIGISYWEAIDND